MAKSEHPTMGATLKFHLAPDRMMIVFNVQGGGAGVALTAEQLDNVMGGLAGIRSQMTPEVPQSFDPNMPTHRHNVTRYMFGLDPFSEEFLLSFRSPGFGWLTFPIASAEIEKMYGLLQAHKIRPATPRSDKKQ